MIVVAAVGAADELEAELTGAELAAGELTDADPLAGAEVATGVEAGAATELLEEEVVAGGAALLDWLAVPWEQAVSNASSAAVPVIRVERDRRFTGCVSFRWVGVAAGHGCRTGVASLRKASKAVDAVTI